MLPILNMVTLMNRSTVPTLSRKTSTDTPHRAFQIVGAIPAGRFLAVADDWNANGGVGFALVNTVAAALTNPAGKRHASNAA